MLRPFKAPKWIRAAFSSLALAAAAPVFAQTGTSLDEAVRMAKEANLTLKGARIDLEAAERQYAASLGALVPSLGASASTRIADYEFDEGVASAQAGLSLSLSPAIALKIRLARMNREAAALKEEAAERELEAGVRKAFYNLILLKESARVLEQGLRTGKATWDRAEQRYRSGLAPELEALSARVKYENQKPSAAKAMEDYEAALGQFKLQIGLAPARPFSPEGSLDASFDPAALDALDWSGPSLSAKSLGKALDIASETKKAAVLSAFSPSLSLSWAATETYPFLLEEWTDGSSLQASLSWSLDFINPLSAQRQSIKGADEALRKAALAAEGQARSDELARATLRSKVARAASTLGAARLAVELAQRTHDLTREAYEKGSKDSLSVANAADDLEEAKLAYLSQENALLAGLIDVEYALGLPFGTLGR